MMPAGLFEAYEAQLEPLRAGRLLDAAQAATAQYAGKDWWDRMVETARGLAREATERARVLFTFNGRPIGTSNGLRRAFGAHVTGGRVES
jgi:hypothetical protein